MAAEQQNVRVQAQIKNQVDGRLNLYRNQNWSGQVAGSYPINLNPLETRDFVHNGIGPNGSKAAIVYERFTNNAAWLVAWIFTNNIYKVYAECGPRQNYANPNWNEIEEKLRTRGGQSTEFDDFETGTELIASINDRGALSITFKLA
ncbi:uncharacterized protein LOC104896151 [Beta vulgaris subsp. vulgaris]|uniref:uncharacterized protein LOC104896151 n=1 Tax=Beta vulgaris subsp. vulgaris TaxID=3555 RepID=UPI002037384C|nr:uncharacterized protein LOC104896151 [Beta vulgaris subsp. vulgaris]